MTFDELCRSLPNGLHDAELVGLHVDYSSRGATIDVNVDVGSSETPADQLEEAYRPARLVFSGLQFIVIDPPAVDEGYQGLSMIDAGIGQPWTVPCKLPPLPADCFLCWLFVVERNSFIRIAAQSVAIEWRPSASDAMTE